MQVFLVDFCTSNIKKITANLLSDNRKLTVIDEKIDGNFRQETKNYLTANSNSCKSLSNEDEP